jgi:hypothetical protein
LLARTQSGYDVSRLPRIQNREVFGGRGTYPPSAIEMAALPMNIAVEVEMVVEMEAK